MSHFITFHKHIKAFLENFKPTENSQLSIDEYRLCDDGLLPESIIIPEVTVERIHVVGPAGIICVLMYRPLNKLDTTLPVVVYMHGGGWSREIKGSTDYLMAKIATDADCAVVYVKYSLSPEAKFPIAVEECYSVLHWITNPDYSHLSRVDPTRVAIGGESSGANIAISVSLLAKERGLKNKIVYSFLYYPPVNDVFNTSTYFEFQNDFPLAKKQMEFLWSQYVPKKIDRMNVLACPLKAPVARLKGLPPTLLITVEADILREEGEEFAKKLMEADVPVTCHRILGMIHGFVTKASLFCEETTMVIHMTTAGLREAFLR
ncbi:alpha/beta hydrolase fold-domain-containing protein [Pilobolus umbonatus]|nr:alpha/beta hydrolase fold-domain-containing protein [Pilobolus umbonatus]